MGFCPIFQMKLNDDDQEQKGWTSDWLGTPENWGWLRVLEAA